MHASYVNLRCMYVCVHLKSHVRSPLQDPLVRRIEGSAVVRGGRQNRLLAAELPRDRHGRFKENGGANSGLLGSFMGGGGGGRRSGRGGVSSVLLTSLTGRAASEAKRIDVISRVMFPLSFAGFNVMYWAYYLTQSYYSTISSESLH